MVHCSLAVVSLLVAGVALVSAHVVAVATAVAAVALVAVVAVATVVAVVAVVAIVAWLVGHSNLWWSSE